MIDLSAPRAPVAITAEDMGVLYERYGREAFAAAMAGDNAACDRLFAEAGRFARAALELRNGTPLPPPPAFTLDANGVDQHGTEWQPRRQGALLGVPLGIREILQLRRDYTIASGEAVALRDDAGWGLSERRRAELLLQAALLDPNVLTFAHNEDAERATARC